MKHVRLALGQSGVGGRFPRRRRRRRRHRRRHRRRRCLRRFRRCRHILGIPFRPGAIFSSVMFSSWNAAMSLVLMAVSSSARNFDGVRVHCCCPRIVLLHEQRVALARRPLVVRGFRLGRLAGWLAGSLYRRRRLGCRCLLRS